MAKGIRVWAAVENGMPVYHLLGSMRETVERELDLCLPHWREEGITIQRAVLTLEPNKHTQEKDA